MEATTEPLKKGEDRYIPVRFRELQEAVTADFFPGDRERLHRVAWLLENLIEFRMAEREESIKEAYLHFCPDDPCVTRTPKSGAELEGLRSRFWSELEILFERANFEKIGRDEFEKAVRAGTTKGLKILVDLDQYRDFAIYYRGLGEKTIKVRRLKTKFRKIETPVPIYLRAVIATGLKDDPYIHLRLFKEIPVRDIESLLPGTKLKMRILDKIKITGGGGAAIYSAVKVGLQGAVLIGKFLLWPLLLLVGIGYLVREVFRFFKIRDEYRKNLIRDLFFQSLDSNLGVINRIVDTTEEEECKEAFLAYAFVLAEQAPVDGTVLKQKIQAYLHKGWGVAPAFDLADALRKLEDLELASVEDGRLKAVDLAKAVEILDGKWDGIFSG